MWFWPSKLSSLQIPAEKGICLFSLWFYHLKIISIASAKNTKMIKSTVWVLALSPSYWKHKQYTWLYFLGSVSLLGKLTFKLVYNNSLQFKFLNLMDKASDSGVWYISAFLFTTCVLSSISTRVTRGLTRFQPHFQFHDQRQSQSSWTFKILKHLNLEKMQSTFYLY